MKINLKLFIVILAVICIMPLIPTNVNATSDTITLISGEDFDHALSIVGSNATKVKFTKEAIPAEKIAGAKLVSESGAKEAYMYLDGDTIYVSPKEANAVIYANSNCYKMFYECSKLISIDFSNFDTSNVTTMWGMFYGCSGLTSLDLSKFDTSNVIYMVDMFSSCRGLTSLDVSKFDTSKVTTMSSMFSGCSGLTSLDVSKFDTSKVTTMRHMFSSCSGLTSLDVSKFDTSKVTDMSGMFSGCSGLTSLDVSKFDTSKVTTMRHMFSGCSGLTSLDVSKFDTSNVTNMEYMFSVCSGLTSLDVSKFDTSNVTNMEYMFYGCSGLTSLDVSKFDTSKVTTMKHMFYGCSGLTSLDLSKFDTSNVTTMDDMFYGCSGLTSLDLSKFDTSKVTTMWGMFDGCSGLTDLDVSKFDTSKVTTMRHMFDGCNKLVTIDNNNISVNNIDKYVINNVHNGFGKNKNVVSTWSSSDENIAKVDENGNVTILGLGTTVLTNKVRVFDKFDFTVTCNFIAGSDRGVLLGGQDFNNVLKEVGKDAKNIKFTKEAIPAEKIAGAKLVSINISKKVYMYLDEDTIYVSPEEENLMIYANSTCDKMFSDMTEITNVNFENFDISNVTSINDMFKNCDKIITVDKSTIKEKEDSEEKIRLVAHNGFSGSKGVVSNWSSSNEKIVKIDENGNITMVGVGDANLVYTVKLFDKIYFTKTCSISIAKKVEEPKTETKVEEIKVPEKTEVIVKEEKVEEPKKEVIPKTGGAISNNILIIMLVSFVSIAGFVTSKIVLKRVKNNK